MCHKYEYNDRIRACGAYLSCHRRRRHVIQTKNKERIEIINM